MAQQAQADGITTVCATPHIRHDHDVRIIDLADRVAALNVSIHAAGIATTVLTGGEVASTALDGLTRAELQAVSLGAGGRWILLEPPPGPLDDRFEAAAARLHDRGLRAVIAHPERHLGSDLIMRLRRLISAGALVQATAAYFTEPGARAGMLELAWAGVVHVLGSDSHSSRAGRPVTLSSGLAALRDVPLRSEDIDWIGRAAPEAIVAGAPLTPPFGTRAQAPEHASAEVTANRAAEP
jgi:tyrosine-protein phosphatase YwqE